MVKCLHDHRLHRCCNITKADLRMLTTMYLKLVFEVAKIHKTALNFTTNPCFVCHIYITARLQKRVIVGNLMLAMCSASWLQDEF